MPLTRGQIVGYDEERLAFKFTMLNGDETTNCQISDAAMDKLVGTDSTKWRHALGAEGIGRNWQPRRRLFDLRLDQAALSHAGQRVFARARLGRIGEKDRRQQCRQRNDGELFHSTLRCLG
jgi:hypothetical protein